MERLVLSLADTAREHEIPLKSAGDGLGGDKFEALRKLYMHQVIQIVHRVDLGVP